MWSLLGIRKAKRIMGSHVIMYISCLKIPFIRQGFRPSLASWISTIKYHSNVDYKKLKCLETKRCPCHHTNTNTAPTQCFLLKRFHPTVYYRWSSGRKHCFKRKTGKWFSKYVCPLRQGFAVMSSNQSDGVWYGRISFGLLISLKCIYLKISYNTRAYSN